MDNKVRLADCPPGLFMHKKTLCFKSLYSCFAKLEGEKDKPVTVSEAYVVATGKQFFGNERCRIAREDVMVRPLFFYELITVRDPSE